MEIKTSENATIRIAGMTSSLSKNRICIVNFFSDVGSQNEAAAAAAIAGKFSRDDV